MTNPPNPPPPRQELDIGAAPPGVPSAELPYWVKIKTSGKHCWLMNPLQLPVAYKPFTDRYLQLRAQEIDDPAALCDENNIVNGSVVLQFWNLPVSAGNLVANLSGDVSHGRFEGIIKVGVPNQYPFRGTAERGRLVTFNQSVP